MNRSYRLLYAVLWLIIVGVIMLELHAVLAVWQR